jgi:hypothetical protein
MPHLHFINSKLKKQGMLVEVRPIESTKWHGKEGAESFTRPKKLQALVNAETMQYATGLTPEEEKELGKILKQDLSPQYNPETPHVFWDSPMASIKLENNTMFFNNEIPLEKVKIKIMKASKFVANSQKELEDGLFPEATHVIHDEAEEAEIIASKVSLQNKAVIEVAKLSKDKKIELILILDDSGKNLKGQSDNFVTVAIDKIVKAKPTEVLRHISMDSKELTNHAVVIEALQKSVLKREGHKILYHDSLLGMDILDVVQYLGEDENQDLRLRIMKAINTD